ncbi:hypothetical protein GGP41_009695 [Bipolaris sorokiniana]|uniref:Uncharacterized protein n=1 Tax=Cochliobolus sativus TaxID=45130 RepID=A0A8H5ZG23_COCSA|nr:hypothetical protein GGP41_009695 [Bipolaris sorokiniana]
MIVTSRALAHAQGTPAPASPQHDAQSSQPTQPACSLRPKPGQARRRRPFLCPLCTDTSILTLTFTTSPSTEDATPLALSGDALHTTIRSHTRSEPPSRSVRPLPPLQQPTPTQEHGKTPRDISRTFYPYPPGPRNVLLLSHNHGFSPVLQPP